MTLTLDPKGSWRRQRFEFCNALEDAVAKNDPKAWADLEKMGVVRAEIIKHGDGK